MGGRDRPLGSLPRTVPRHGRTDPMRRLRNRESFYTPDRSHFLLLLSSRTRREVLSHTLLAPRQAHCPATNSPQHPQIDPRTEDRSDPALPPDTRTHTHATIIARVARSQTRRASLVTLEGHSLRAPTDQRILIVCAAADVSERGRNRNRILGVGRALGELRAERNILGH